LITQLAPPPPPWGHKVASIYQYGRGPQRDPVPERSLLPDFQLLYGTEEQCEAALEKACWPDGFRCPRCNGNEHGLVYGRGLKRHQCRNCGHQATLTAGTIMQATKLPLATWFLAFYMIGQAKTGISSLELSRHLGVNYDTAWLLHNKVLRAMADREEAYLPAGKDPDR
jgi:transposase-like protein